LPMVSACVVFMPEPPGDDGAERQHRGTVDWN